MSLATLLTPNMENVLTQCFIISLLGFANSNGSSLTFESTPRMIEPLISNNLTMRCSLKDSSATPSGSIIGRSVDKNSERSVGDQTTSIQYVTSIVITHDGKDVATLTEHQAATVYDSSQNVHVSGQLTTGSVEQGFLQLTWQYPNGQQTGSYGCNVTGVDKKGHSYEFSKSVNVDEGEISFQTLVVHISELKGDRDRMRQEMSDIKSENALLKQKMQELESRCTVQVFFSAALSKFLTLGSGKVLIYDLVLSNTGGGYDNTTGIFTTPVSGSYNLQISALAQHNQSIALNLLHNDKQVFSIWSTSTNSHSEGTSNSAIIYLAQGDTVKVISYHGSDSYLLSKADDTHVTFNGHLVGFA